MPTDHAFEAVPCGLGPALKDRGFNDLTEIQRAVLNPEVLGQDLRMSSETGSGKTVAVGFVVARELGELSQAQKNKRGKARPAALIVAPTRELAAQIGRELQWLLAPLGARLTVVTGGTSIRDDFRALARCPHLVVGTPGRLVDHLRQASLDLADTRTVVLDEADEMLDMGFRDDLETILDSTNQERHTHLVSATFPSNVKRLAKRYQRNAVTVEGTPVGAPNQDITHIGLSVHQRDRHQALLNVLLSSPGKRTLVFARTRVATTSLATELRNSGFTCDALNGDMSQRERTATLESFRSGAIRILVATDVAARGLDIEDITQVIHFDLPENDDTYTHRSGRTGRAGKAGASIALVPPHGRGRTQGLAKRLGIDLQWSKVPSPADVRSAAQARLGEQLDALESHEDESLAFAEELLSQHDPRELVAALLERSNFMGPCHALEVAEVKAPAKTRSHDGPSRPQRDRSGSFTKFHVNWGTNHGATTSRLLAVMCKRGHVRSHDVGAIRVSDFSSIIEVSSAKAKDFEKAARRPGGGQPKLRVRLWQDQKAGSKKKFRSGKRAA